MSGSSALTFLPGLARSGNTHSFEGFANTLPAEEDVSLLLPAAGGAIDAMVEVDAVLGALDAIGGRAGIAIFPLPLAVAGAGRGRTVDEEGVGREARLGVIDVLSGRGRATDMARKVELK